MCGAAGVTDGLEGEGEEAGHEALDWSGMEEDKVKEMLGAMHVRLAAEHTQLNMDGLRNVWIVKPGHGTRGQGIKCYDSLKDIISLASKRGGGKKSGGKTSSGTESVESSSTTTTTTGTESDLECRESDEVTIYKYTITSSQAPEDGKWADRVFGCSFRNVTDTSGCSKLGKTSCFPTTLAYGLHFVENEVSYSGPKNIAYWDAYQSRLNEHSFEKDVYNQFMHYSLTFYTPDLSDTVKYLKNNEVGFLARKGVSPLDGQTYYTIVVQSPSGKVFEMTSTTLDNNVLKADNIAHWKHDSECPNCHFSDRYKRVELDHWYSNFSKGDLHETSVGLPVMMPIRNNIAVPSIDAVAEWFSANVPALDFKYETAGTDDGTEACKTATTNIAAYTETDFDMEVRFVENSAAHALEHTVKDFVDYIEAVNKNWTAPDYGWTAWYDRHLGIMFNTCPLDDYMRKFAEEDVSFHPHGRGGSTQDSDTARDHCWTEGVQGYGMEMQGNFSFTYKDCYQVFDWCTWDTDPVKDVCNDRR